MVFLDESRPKSPPRRDPPLDSGKDVLSKFAPSNAISLLGRLSICLSIFTILVLYGAFSPQLATLERRLNKSVPDTKCVWYDRPPRTGSTTIARTLGQCMVGKGYDVARLFSGVRSTGVTSMVSSQSSRMALVRNHVAVSEHDLDLLENFCGELLYITSAAPMKKRLYSAAKYQLSNGHGNSTVSPEMLENLVFKEKENQRIEKFLEAYPHVTEERTAMDVIPDRLIPDYVINQDSLQEDLGPLLEALNCDSAFESLNVHSAEGNESTKLDSIKLYQGDAMYRWLLDVSKDNKRGLEKARGF